MSNENSKKLKMSVPSVKLNSGFEMPLLGYGTFLSKPGEVEAGVREALKVGYRAFDCAAVYANEAEIGGVFDEVFNDEKSGIKREDVFITSKLPAGSMKPDVVKATLQKTLDDLKLKYIDLYLIHIPIAVEKDDEGNSHLARPAGFGLHQTWAELEKLVDEGLIKSIGVSNYNVQLLNDLLNYARIKPAVNQVERHPYLQQEGLLKLCETGNVFVTAYAPLGAPGLRDKKDHGYGITPLLENEVIAEIAKKYNKTNAQVLLRWQIDSNVIVIPKSVTPKRIAENFDVLDFKLTEEDLKKIKELDQNCRYFRQIWTGADCFA